MYARRIYLHTSEKQEYMTYKPQVEKFVKKQLKNVKNMYPLLYTMQTACDNERNNNMLYKYNPSAVEQAYSSNNNNNNNNFTDDQIFSAITDSWRENHQLHQHINSTIDLPRADLWLKQTTYQKTYLFTKNNWHHIRNDMKTLMHCAEMNNGLQNDLICFLAQQVVEKSLKVKDETQAEYTFAPFVISLKTKSPLWLFVSHVQLIWSRYLFTYIYYQAALYCVQHEEETERMHDTYRLLLRCAPELRNDVVEQAAQYVNTFYIDTRYPTDQVMLLKREKKKISKLNDIV